VSEADLRYPGERGAFLFFSVVNGLILVATLLIVTNGADWLSRHPFLEKRAPQLKAVAVAAIIAIPARVLLRNVRRLRVIGSSVRVSTLQFPEIYSILVGHCRRLGMDPPELYLSAEATKDSCRAFSTHTCHYVVLGTTFLQPELAPVHDTLSFELARELGRIRVGHTAWWNELLIAYVLKVPYLRNPLMHFRHFTYDRYGAYLAPEGLLGLTGHATGRLLLRCLDVEPYLRDLNESRGVWMQLASLTQETPPLAVRVRKLYAAGLFDVRNDLKRLKKEPLHA